MTVNNSKIIKKDHLLLTHDYQFLITGYQ